MCVVVSKYFDDTGWVLAKNRDRNYVPTIKMVQTLRDGVERLYLFDTQTGYSEGLNEFGVSIVSAAVSVKTDEKEGKTKKASVNGTSPDGKRIRSALLEKTVDAAVKKLIESKIPGNTFVTDGKQCILIEGGYHPEDSDQKNYESRVVKCERNKTYVRTNHGVLLPFLGYSDKIPEQKDKRKSSVSRYDIAHKEANKCKDPQELLNSIGVTPSSNPQMNPIRLKKNKEEDMLTTGQILIVPSHSTLTYRPTISEIELDNYNKINGVKSKTYFEIISNRQLTTYKDFVTEDSKYLGEQTKILNFKSFLSEAADSAQNLHMTHADEDIFERGDEGAEAAVAFCNDIAKNLGKGETKLTVKWDGAPALFAGWDPADGKFFIGTKSVFAKNPKLYKTQADIDVNESGGKAEKLKVALEELPKVGIPKGAVVQGDILWTDGDQRYETIDGKRYVTAHPNTIVYAWEAESEIGKQVRNARLGIVWHTMYTGRGDLSMYRASFGVDVSKFKKIRTVWQDDAYFKGSDIAFTADEYAEIFALTSDANSYIGNFDRLVDIMNSIPSSAGGANVKTYINSLIRQGKLPNPERAAMDYINYLKKYWEEKVIGKVKTDKAKDQKRAALEQLLQEIRSNMSTLQNAFLYVDKITRAKMIIVRKLNALSKEKTFVKTANGFKVTAPEGFVAISGEKGAAVKFVDRLSFSHFNFSSEYIKGWQR